MECKRYRDTLSDVAAGDPAPVALALHLAACAPCRRELAELENALGAAARELEGLATMEPSAGFKLRVRAAIDRRHAVQVRPLAWLWPACVAASAMIVAVVLLLTARPPRSGAELAQTEAPDPPIRVTDRRVVADSGSVSLSPVPPVASLPRPEPRSVPPVAAKPLILVPAGEARALMAFVASLGPDVPVAEAPVASTEQVPALQAAPPITIQPIDIVPLDQPLISGPST